MEIRPEPLQIKLYFFVCSQRSTDADIPHPTLPAALYPRTSPPLIASWGDVEGAQSTQSAGPVRLLYFA